MDSSTRLCGEAIEHMGIVCICERPEGHDGYHIAPYPENIQLAALGWQLFHEELLRAKLRNRDI